MTAPLPANAAFDATYFTSLLPLPTGQVCSSTRLRQYDLLSSPRTDL